MTSSTAASVHRSARPSAAAGRAAVTRIGLFLPSLDCGGAERVMLNLAHGLVARGLDVDVVVLQGKGPFLHLMPPRARLVDLRARRVVSGVPALVRYLRRDQPAVLLSALEFNNLAAVWAARLARTGTRVVISARTHLSRSLGNGSGAAQGAANAAARTRPWKHSLLPLLVRQFYPWADDIVAVSHGVAEDLARILGIAPTRIRVIHNAIVTPELLARAREPVTHPWCVPEGPPLILAVGRLTAAKDYPTLLRAFALLRRQRPARLLILGEGQERPMLEALVEKLDLQDAVALPGFAENPYAYMARASVFVLSSAWEGFGNVLTEALAVGTPVVSTDCQSGPAEILQGGRSGILVPVGDPAALAAAIARALDHPPNRALLRARAEDFSLEKMVNEYLAVLHVEPAVPPARRT